MENEYRIILSIYYFNIYIMLNTVNIEHFEEAKIVMSKTLLGKTPIRHNPFHHVVDFIKHIWQHPKKRWILIGGIVIVIAIITTAVSMNTLQAQKESAYQNAIIQNDLYIEGMQETCLLAEQVMNQTSQVWHDAIFDDYTIVNGELAFDFEEALSILYDGYASDGTLNQLESGLATMEQGIIELKDMPEELQTNYELTYSIYKEAKPFVEMAISPEGSYTTYSSATEEMERDLTDAIEDYDVRKIELNDIE